MSDNYPWVVVDEESAPLPGDDYWTRNPIIPFPLTILGRFANHDEASLFISRQDDQDKIDRGGFGIDGPEET